MKTIIHSPNLDFGTIQEAVDFVKNTDESLQVIKEKKANDFRKPLMVGIGIAGALLLVYTLTNYVIEKNKNKQKCPI